MRLIPFGKAIEMILTGKRIDAREALNLNLVSRVVPQNDLMKTVKELAVQLCDSAPLAIRAAKEAVYQGYDIPLVEGLKLENELSGRTMRTKDYSEGRTAFLEKRKPEYKGI
jgi:enoyl-CoA hydratase/carnithine racemase